MTSPARSWRMVAAISASALALAACGGGDDDADTATPDATGSPAATAAEGDGTLTIGTLLPQTGNLAFLGPPEFVEATPTGETWHYAYGSGQALSSFAFERASYAEARPTFESWVLVRTAAYEEVWRRAVRRWREGQVR